MKVLVIAQYFPPDLGGSATRAFNLARGLVLNGCEVTVVAAVPHYPHGKIPPGYWWRPVKVEYLDGMRIVRTFMPPLESRGFLRRLFLLWSFAVSSLFALPFVGRVDAVWASSWIPGLAYSRLKRRPLALNEDDLKLEDLVGLKLVKEGSLVLRVAERVFRFFLMRSDVVTPISPGYVNTLVKKYGVNKSRVHVVRGGVDLAVFDRHASIKHRRQFTILYSGAFSVAYDFDLALRAARILQEKDSSVEFVFQGKGELLESIESQVKELGLSNVRVVDRVISRAEVAELLSGADALLLPLRDFGRPYLGFSSKLYEYQAVGKPIVCSGRGLPSDFVEETNCGLTVRPGDYEALAKAVMELKDNPKLARMMGENGRKYVESEASVEAIGLRMKEILDHLEREKGESLVIN